MKLINIIIFLFFSYFSFTQQFNQCQVYQFPGTDSLNSTLVLVKQYNPNGLLLSETYTGYKQGPNQVIPNKTVFYSYENSLCIEELTDEYARTILR